MKTTYTKILIIIACIYCGFMQPAEAQTVKHKGKISGKILDEMGAAMPYATVGLLKAKDSSVVRGGLTNDAGSYKFDHVAQGAYIIKVTAVNYVKAASAVINIDSAEVSIPAIRLSTASKTLKTVNITAAKPLIERKLDRTVMNVENSVLAAGNSALEILERAPGVTVDKDDKISLNGKQGVTVMIDGKLTYLSSAQLATLLRATDGNTVKSIEIITNPSAKYDAAGNSGIINIILKKNKTTGTNGSLSATGGIGAYPKGEASLNLNHKEGALNVFGSFSHGNRKQSNNLFIDRIVDASGTKTFFTQHTFMPQTWSNNSYRIGTDYDITKNNTIGFVTNGYFNEIDGNNSNNTLIGTAPGTTNSNQNTYSTINQTFKNFAFNVNDKFTIDTAGQELSVDIDYSKFDNTNNAHYDSFILAPDGSTQAPPSFIRNQSPSTITINTQKFDYTKPLTKKVKLETGFKASNVKTDNDLEAQTLANQQWNNDPTRTNRFIYTEKLVAGYISLSETFKKTSVQLGLRGENTKSTGNSITQNQVVDRSYFDLFPSVFINQTLTDKHEVSFSYSRRIDRPGYDNLNPFVYYLDQYTYGQGNPYLKPQYTQSFGFNYTYNKSINLSLNYSYTSDVISEVLLPNNNKTYQTSLNLKSQTAYSANINAPFNFTKWWSGNANINIFYMRFKADSLPEGNKLDDGQVTVQFRTSHTFLLGKGFKGEVSTDYQSPLTYGLLKIEQKYGVDAGFSRSFADKKANLKFSVSDIFNTQKSKLSSVYTHQALNIMDKFETRVARLTFTYNFGNAKIKMRQHSGGSDSEKSRVKGNN